MKVTLRPSLRREWLYQALDYLLLDYHDEYGLNEAGFYLPRQDLLFTWSAEELVKVAAATVAAASLARAASSARSWSRPRRD